MGLRKISVALICFILVAKSSPSYAQNSPQDYVDAHNAARQQVGVGPLMYDDNVATYAQNHANQRVNDCRLVHSGGPYGENLANATGFSFTVVDAVHAWVAEKASYGYNSNTCKQGEECGHYTQVIWRDSLRVGCAIVQCNGGRVVRYL